METTNIEWTDKTWNPTTGCDKVSQGCKNCYAARMAKRLQAMKQPRYANGFKVTLQHDLIKKPYEWKKPRKIFVNSMSDIFHKDIPFEFTNQIFDTMRNCDWHTFQVLTKRPEIMKEFTQNYATANELPYLPQNIWMGTSVESMDVIQRIDELLAVPTNNRFLSCEPLLSALDLDRYLATGNIHWVIVGGESGPHAREMKEEWALDIRDQCQRHNVPFFFKQWGGTNKKATGRLLDGKEYNEFPKIDSISYKS